MNLRPRPALPTALTWLLGGIVLAACSSSSRAPAPLTPGVHEISVRANPNNVLSAIVSFDAKDVTSARVLASGGGEDTATPVSTITDGRQEIVVLGLLPDTDYTLTLEYTLDGSTSRSDARAFRTGSLPHFLAERMKIFAVGTSSGGFNLTNFASPDASRHYVIAFDDQGRVRWYHYVPGNGAHAEQLPNGNYATFVGITTGFQNDPSGHFIEFTPGGEIVGRVQAPAPYLTDNHELLLTPADDGGWMTHYFSYDIRVTDTRSIGGHPDTNLAGHQIRRYRPDGTLDFLFDAWDHFSIEDWIEEPAVERTFPDGDFDHPNSLAFDLDGNYIVSWRNMAEVTKIDARTGEILWRFGGRNNQFQILDDPLYDPKGGFAFCGQHSVSILPNGNLLMFDNGLRHDPPESRAVEYELNVEDRTARMVWEFRHNPPLYTPFTGNADRLPNGNTIVGFAFMGAVVEVDPSGNVLWEAAITVDGLSSVHYRIKRIDSLYGQAR